MARIVKWELVLAITGREAAAVHFEPFVFRSSEELSSPEAIRRQCSELPPASALQQ